MKNLKITIAAISLIAMAFACRMDRRHVVIASNSNDSTLRIEYSGWTVFNAAGTDIKSITPNGYAKYKKNDREIIAESDANGNITYQVNGDKQKQLNAGDREFLAQAVKDMIKHGHNNDGK